MSAELRQLPTFRAGREQAVLDLLEDSKTQGYDTVIVFGFDSVGNVQIRHAGIPSITTMVGALERAKFELIRDDTL